MSTYPFKGRRFVRALAAEVIYRSELLGEMPSVAMADVLQREELTPDQREMLSALVDAYSQHRNEIDNLLAEVSPRWRPERMLILDRSIIKAGIAEALSGRTRFEVVISEAVEIAKAMSTEKSPAFVNGVLDAAIHQLGLADVPEGR